MATCAMPHIDPSVRYVGVSKLRNLNATNLKEQTDETLVIQENGTPLAVLLSYKLINPSWTVLKHGAAI